MSNELVSQLLELLNKTEFPEVVPISAAHQHVYELGLDLLDSYRGHPAELIEAMKAFLTSSTKAYALAGVAGVLIAASYIQGGNYEESGLQEAEKWLNQAQELEPDRVEINFLEAILYINWKKLDLARKVIQFLYADHPDNYHVCLAEMRYWTEQKNTSQVEHWYRTAAEAAHANPRRLVNALNNLAKYYLVAVDYEKAIRAYEQLTKYDPNDPWLWHNLSIAYYETRQDAKAVEANKRALSIMDFGAARHVQEVLKQHTKKRWLW